MGVVYDFKAVKTCTDFFFNIKGKLMYWMVSEQ